ncbi:MAG: helix-turn-helix domain-containing protein [Lachnospiraceae bacterium]|nr:helix-turn-helix domain-containing protein [Lachnospiraceae bacterium]
MGVYLKKNKESMIPHNLPIHLDMLLAKKGISKPEVVRDSHLDRKYIYQIFSGEKNPSRDKLIALAFGLHLSDEETQTMLKVSGNRELYVRDERDAIILFALQKKKDIWETNELLSDHNFTALGAPKD